MSVGMKPDLNLLRSFHANEVATLLQIVSFVTNWRLQAIVTEESVIVPIALSDEVINMKISV